MGPSDNHSAGEEDGRDLRFSVRSCSLDELKDTTPLLQSGFWGTLKSFGGHIPYAFTIRYPDTGQTFPLLVLVRDIVKGAALAYVPHGPMVPFPPGPTGGGRFLQELTEALRPYLPNRCLFIRYDLPWTIEQPDEFSFPPPPHKAVMDIQPPSTVLIDLTPDEETLLASMKSKTRYNVRLAYRKGVTVEGASEEELEEWYRLYERTAFRDRITIHHFDYYKKLFTLADAYENAPTVRLLKATADDVMIAGIIVCFHGKGATYLYGASSNTRRNLMPNYALQWEAMKRAKAAGCLWYDLFGIPAKSDPESPMHGLYRFKVGFGGDIVHRPGCWDIPLKPRLYYGYKAAEKVRRYYYKKVKKR